MLPRINSLLQISKYFVHINKVYGHKASLGRRYLNHDSIVVEQNGRAYDIYSRLLKKRIICLMGPITDIVASGIITELLFLQSESSKNPIHLYINSPGGSVIAGLGIYDTMQYVLPPISTWCIGQAGPIASLLLAAGSKGMRHSLPHARIMIYQPLGVVQGQVADIQIQAREILKLKQELKEIYVKHTGQNLKAITKSLERQTFMNPIEAKEFGIIDKVLAHPMQEKVAEATMKKTD